MSYGNMPPQGDQPPQGPPPQGAWPPPDQSYGQPPYAQMPPQGPPPYWQMPPQGPPPYPPVQPPQQSSGRKKGCIILVVLALLMCGGLGGYRSYVLAQHEESYRIGHQAYLQSDCNAAMQHFESIFQGAFGESAASYASARAEANECRVFQEAVDLQQRDAAGALLAYSAFVMDFPKTPLRDGVDRQVHALFQDHAADELAQVGVCRDLDTLLERKLIPDADSSLPSLYAGCGATFEAEKDYASAMEMYQRFSSEYPSHDLSEEVELGLARAMLADAQTSGAGALPAPQVSGDTGSGTMVVIIQNDSPEALTMVFSGPEVRVEELGPCTECDEFGLVEPTGCPEKGPVGTYELTPGQYNVVVRASSDASITPFYGTWDLADGQEYYSCFYLVSR